MSDEALEGAHVGLDRDGVLRLAARLAHRLESFVRRARSGTTIGLVGELGAGKTTFAQGFVAALEGGADLYVTSPTYAIIQLYETEPPVRHVDLYRLESAEELEAIGFGEVTEAPGFNLIEWIGRIPEAVQGDWIEVELLAVEHDLRTVQVVAHGAGLEAWLRA